MCTARFPTISHGIPGPMSKGEGYPPLLDIPIPLDIPTPLWTCPSPGHTLPAGHTYPLDIRTHPQKGPGTRNTHPWRGHGIRDTPPPWTDRHLERHYLPAALRAVTWRYFSQMSTTHLSDSTGYIIMNKFEHVRGGPCTVRAKLNEFERVQGLD